MADQPIKRKRINSKKKGNAIELQFANWLKENLDPKARRGASQGFGGSCRPDVETVLPIHFEVKGSEALNIYKAMDQSIRDCHPASIPVVVHKKNRTPFHVTLLLSDIFVFAALIDGKKREFAELEKKTA